MARKYCKTCGYPILAVEIECYGWYTDYFDDGPDNDKAGGSLEGRDLKRHCPGCDSSTARAEFHTLLRDALPGESVST